MRPDDAEKILKRLEELKNAQDGKPDKESKDQMNFDFSENYFPRQQEQN